MKRAQTVILGLTVLGLRVLGVTDLIKIQGHSEIAFGSQEGVGLDAHFRRVQLPSDLEKSDACGWLGDLGRLYETSSTKSRMLVKIVPGRTDSLVRKWLTEDAKSQSW